MVFLHAKTRSLRGLAGSNAVESSTANDTAVKASSSLDNALNNLEWQQALCNRLLHEISQTAQAARDFANQKTPNF